MYKMNKIKSFLLRKKLPAYINQLKEKIILIINKFNITDHINQFVNF